MTRTATLEPLDTSTLDRHEFAADDAAQLTIDFRDGSTSITGWTRGDNARTIANHNGLTATFLLRTDLHPASYAAIVADADVTALTRRVRAGFDTDWRDGRMRGTFTADATTALEALHELIEERWGDVARADGIPGDYQIWDAGAWFQDGLAHEFERGEELDALIERLTAEADGENAHVLDLERTVRALHSDWLDQQDDA